MTVKAIRAIFIQDYYMSSYQIIKLIYIKYIVSLSIHYLRKRELSAMRDMKLSTAIYHSTIWGQEDFFFKEINYFIQ